MGIFDKRPLAFILSVMLFGFVAFASGEVWIRIACVCLIPLLLLIIILIPSGRRALGLSSLLLLIAILLSFVYFDLWFEPEARFEGAVTATAKVRSIKQTENSNEIILDTSSIGGKAFTKYKLISYLNDNTASGFYEGDIIKIDCEIRNLDSLGFDNAESYYKPQGISGYAEIIGDITVIKDGTPPLSSHFSFLREYLRRRAVMTSDDRTGNLTGALLFGERDMLDNGLRADFKAIGISHILALSGLHLSILALGIGKLLSLLKVSKKPRTVFIILFTLIYMAFTGFSSSVVRAGIMLIISSLLFLLSRSHDSITSLISAVFIIVFITPYSAFDLSLWLSAFATLGVVSVGEYKERNNGKKKNIFLIMIDWFKLSILSSLFAVMATFAFSAIVFGGYSVLSPISTMIFSPLVDLFMYLSTFQLILGGFIPIKIFTIPLSELIYNLSELLSGLDNVYLSTSFPSVYISAIGCTVFFLAFLIIKVKHKKSAVTILTLVYLSFLGISYIENISYCSVEQFEHISNNECSDIIINADSERAVISSSSYDKDQAYATLESIHKMKYADIDKYFLTHYNFNIPENLDIVLSRIDIDSIFLPSPRNEKEDLILTRIRKVTDQFGCDIQFYDTGNLSVGEYRFELVYSGIYGTEPVRAAYTVYTDSYRFTYLSSGMLCADYYNDTMDLIRKSDSVVFGWHGSKYKDKIFLDYSTDKKQIIILNSDNLFFTQNNLKEKEENGCEIYSHPSDNVSNCMIRR